jgi:lipopolysaccharide/colanic/teichoic acid biosynthesis glycosyltransferase
VGASLILVITLPISLLLALTIRVWLGKGVLYTQRRIGAHGKPFTILKFRTMRADRRRSENTEQNGQDRRSTHKGQHDPRHTELGRMLRKLSLDELPQLINVLRGEMSLVGPRPELVSIASSRGYVDHIRHEVRPGMTGPYQVSDLRLNGDLRDGLEVDEEYVNDLTFANDVRYLLRTVKVMIGSTSGS